MTRWDIDAPGEQAGLDTFSTAGRATGELGSGSRPSGNNCTTDASAPDAADSLDSESWWRRKNEIVDRFIEEMPERASRPISVRGKTKLRSEAVIEKRGGDGGYRSQTWSTVLNEFLSWYNDYRDSYLVFESPEAEEVRAPMENSHQPDYGDRYYARIKGFERQILKEYDEPYSAMITLSGSSRNGNGGWRCSADHLRDVIESWRPDRGRGVYHALRDALEGREWEYAIVVEKHQSGYGHVHCAIFVDGEISEGMFHNAIDTHLRVCDIAHRDAHDYYHPDSAKNPISLNRIDPNADRTQAIQNLGSYVGEYIGAYGESLFERDISELIFRAAMWATGSQMVRFSTGANEMIKRDRESRSEDAPNGSRHEGDPKSGEEDLAFEDQDHRSHSETGGWSILGFAPGEEEEYFEIRKSNVVWREIDDASHLDPPNLQPPDRPKKRTQPTALSNY